MKQRPHDYMACQSNICAADPELQLRTWYPFEPVCTASPMQKWQKTQRKLHKLFLQGKLREPDRYFFKENLQRIVRVTPATLGIDPEKKLN